MKSNQIANLLAIKHPVWNRGIIRIFFNVTLAAKLSEIESAKGMARYVLRFLNFVVALQKLLRHKSQLLPQLLWTLLTRRMYLVEEWRAGGKMRDDRCIAEVSGLMRVANAAGL